MRSWPIESDPAPHRCKQFSTSPRFTYAGITIHTYIAGITIYNVGNSNAVSLPICYRYLLRDGAAARL